MLRAALAAVLVAAAAAAPADAAPVGAPAPPLELPGEAGAAGAATWIVGVRDDSRSGAAIARRHGARRIAGPAYLVPRARARELASALGDRLLWAEPNV